MTAQAPEPTPTPAHAQRPARKFTAICAYCGRSFEAESDRARYCCPAHKQAAYRDRLTRKAQAEAVNHV